MYESLLILLMFSSQSPLATVELVSLELKENNIGPYDHKLYIHYSRVKDKVGVYNFTLISKSYGLTLTKTNYIPLKDVQEMVNSLLNDGLMYLPSIKNITYDHGVFRDLSVTVIVSGKLKKIHITAYGAVTPYDFGTETDEWKKWVRQAKLNKNNPNPIPIPSWLYDRIFERIFSAAYKNIPDNTLENFFRNIMNQHSP